jgi:hypothetical protein
MDQISKKKPNPKCRLFLKIYSKGTWRQVSTVYLSEAPDPLPPPRYTLYGMNTIHTLYILTLGRGGGGSEPVRRLEGR